MEIVDNKALRIRVRSPDRFTSIIPKSHYECEVSPGVHEIIVNWGYDESLVLKNMGIKSVPSPIRRNYLWPGMFKPMAHQKETAEFLTMHPRCFCFDEMGTGKTGAAAWAADYLMQIGKVRRVLIICPVSIMQAAWQQDLFKVLMHRTVGIAHGTKDKRVAVIDSDVEFVIINYDGVQIVEDEIKAGGFDLLILDEGNCFVAGALVSTPTGLRAIETLTAGEEVLTSSGVTRIRQTSSQYSNELITLGLSNGKTITCTKEHPFFTDRGWIGATHLQGRRLIHDTDMPYMQRALPSADIEVPLVPAACDSLGASLLAILREETVFPTEPREHNVQPRDTGIASHLGGLEQRDSANRGASGADIRDVKNYWAQAVSTTRKWNGANRTRSNDTAGNPSIVHMELRDIVGEEARRLSYELQSRLWKPHNQDSIRGGREVTHDASQAGAGSQERSQVEGTWVDSVTHHKQGDGALVYNLELEGTPHYYVEGCLVHNCIKNPQAKRSKSIRRLATADTRIWLMTGTPAAQSPEDAYGLAKLVSPERVPKFFGSWRDMVMQKITMFKWVPRARAKDLVYAALQPAIRHTKEECLDLPEMVFIDRHVPMTPQQVKYYKILKEQMLALAAGEEITAVNAAAMLNKLLQLSTGCVYSDGGGAVEFDVKPRLDALADIIDESLSKVIIFAPFRHTISMLERELAARGYTTATISGDVSSGKRGEIFSAFQYQTDPKVIIIQPQAAAHGVTLTAASTVVWFGPTTSLDTYLQANARAHRKGQINKVTVVHLYGSAAEEKLYKALSTRGAAHVDLMGLYKEVMET